MAVLSERAYRDLGAHFTLRHGTRGARFAVWTPHAASVSVIGGFNSWHLSHDPLEPRGDGVFEGFIPAVHPGSLYKFHIVTPDGRRFDKADPFAFAAETPPGTASILYDAAFDWHDEEWMKHRGERIALDRPVIFYEVHAGSWRRVPGEQNRVLTYREMAPLLSAYCNEMNFTHVEFLPLTEHPYYGSWGYQPGGYFAPAGRQGAPADLMFLVDHLHRNGIGAILDWVPAQFSTDAHGLALFDGTRLFEREEPSEWSSHAFDLSRPEVRNFLISSALFWLDRYHFDGLRVDGVATMLDPDGIGFLKQLNTAVYANYPDVHTIAEESGSFPRVSRPVEAGGLGFGMKWDLGWMHDTLEYLRYEPAIRKDHHNLLTFRQMYAYNENWVLPLSHDEVKSGFGSLLAKMPGDDWRKFANVRLLLAWMYAQPGKKLLFMGGEFGQRREWDPDGSLDWHLLHQAPHGQLRSLAGYLNWLYRKEPSLHQLDCEPAGFEWIDCCDTARSVVSFERRARDARDVTVAVFNFTPEPRFNYRIGAPLGGSWREVLNTDAAGYGGSGYGNMGTVDAAPIPWHGHRLSLNLTLPPLGALLLRPISTSL